MVLVVNIFQGLNVMDQKLPPPELVITWLDIIKDTNMPINIINKRTKLLYYFFGSIELAYMYVEQSQFHHQKVS